MGKSFESRFQSIQLHWKKLPLSFTESWFYHHGLSKMKITTEVNACGEQGARRDKQVFKTCLVERKLLCQLCLHHHHTNEHKNKTGSPSAKSVQQSWETLHVSPLSPARKYKCHHRRFLSETTLVIVSSGYKNMIYCLFMEQCGLERKNVDSED